MPKEKEPERRGLLTSCHSYTAFPYQLRNRQVYFTILSLILQFEVKNMLLTVGCDYLADQRINEDGALIKLIKDQGAIILVKGNVPQVRIISHNNLECLMCFTTASLYKLIQVIFSYHTTNRVWGTSINPHNKERSCGGSTGGDSGMVAARLIPLGIGTDLGGSLRIPAEFTGVCAFKATS